MGLITPVEKLEQLDPTDEQDKALKRVFEQHILDSKDPDFAYMTFTDWIVKHVHKAIMDDCIMAAVPNMWLGIETNGYTHS